MRNSFFLKREIEPTFRIKQLLLRSLRPVHSIKLKTILLRLILRIRYPNKVVPIPQHVFILLLSRLRGITLIRKDRYLRGRRRRARSNNDIGLPLRFQERSNPRDHPDTHSGCKCVELTILPNAPNTFVFSFSLCPWIFEFVSLLF